MKPSPPPPISLNLGKLLAPLNGSLNNSLELRMCSMSEGSNPAGSSSTQPAQGNIRSIVATTFLPKGTVLATIPAAYMLCGSTSHTIVQQTFGGKRYKELLAFAAERERRVNADSQERKGDAAGYNSRADESFVVLSSRNCILMLCALVAARVFNAQQLYSSRQRLETSSKSDQLSTSKSSAALLPTFSQLGLVSSPPPWLLHWTKYGLPTKHFAAGIALSESQKLKIEPVVRRRLNILGNDDDLTKLLGPAVPHTLLDGDKIQLGTSLLTESVARRNPELELGGITKNDDIHNTQQQSIGGVSPPLLIEGATSGDGQASSQPSEVVPSEEESSLEPFSPNRTKDLVEVVASPKMVTQFLKDQPIVLSENKQRALTAHNYGMQEGFTELALRAAALDKQLLRPIAKILLQIPTSNAATQDDGTSTIAGEKEEEDAVDDDATNLGPLMDDLRWAHAMLRSRAVNASWSNIGAGNAEGGSGASGSSNNLIDPALIPAVDLLNHAHVSSANTTFVPMMIQQRLLPTMPNPQITPTRAFGLVASRDINEGDILTCYYGHYRQRIILFDKDPQRAAEELSFGSAAAAALAASPSSASQNGSMIDLSSVPVAARERLAVAADMKRIENLQRWGNGGPRNGENSLSDSQNEDDNLNESKRMLSDPRHTRQRLDESVTEKYFTNAGRGAPLRDQAVVAQKKFSGLSDADWSWYFGFTKSEAEKAIEAKTEFNKDLRRRVANMTDGRRKGHKGEYVVGVPPGLQQLNEHRARLQQSQYGGYAVFPPQRV